MIPPAGLLHAVAAPAPVQSRVCAKKSILSAAAMQCDSFCATPPPLAFGLGGGWPQDVPPPTLHTPFDSEGCACLLRCCGRAANEKWLNSLLVGLLCLVVRTSLSEVLVVVWCRILGGRGRGRRVFPYGNVSACLLLCLSLDLSVLPEEWEAGHDPLAILFQPIKVRSRSSPCHHSRTEETEASANGQRNKRATGRSLHPPTWVSFRLPPSVLYLSGWRAGVSRSSQDLARCESGRSYPVVVWRAALHDGIIRPSLLAWIAVVTL